MDGDRGWTSKVLSGASGLITKPVLEMKNRKSLVLATAVAIGAILVVFAFWQSPSSKLELQTAAPKLSRVPGYEN
jgi:hypothetical protein